MVLLYLDENVNRQFGLMLLALGYDVVFARDVHPAHTSDHIHLAWATTSGRVLITHDRDYRLLHCAWCDWFREFAQSPLPRHAGIVMIPQDPVLPRGDAVAVVRSLLENATAESLTNRRFDWTATYGWQELDARAS
ncbi:MAG TPA: DUF5615 family PIN-like protein [Thermomicrobiales bacterium]|nr:DUF5615 family PIN-like protein [Thermomicrobiales bacterium]